MTFSTNNVILSFPWTRSGQASGAKNLVVGKERVSNSENEIPRGAEGPEPCREAQDDIKISYPLNVILRSEATKNLVDWRRK
jgi:hypothetical protein